MTKFVPKPLLFDPTGALTIPALLAGARLARPLVTMTWARSISRNRGRGPRQRARPRERAI
jgi:hypothetical protein